MYVICFYWEGDRWQEQGVVPSTITKDISFQNHLKRVGKAPINLVSHYVNNLYFGVTKWAVHPFKFICFTNKKLETDPNIEIRSFPMVTDKGVLPRMYMFSEEAGLFGHQVLCIDIDVVITGSLEDIMGYRGRFCTRVRWQRGQDHLPDGDIMSFQAGPETEALFWTPLIKDIDHAIEIANGGRERMWITHQVGDNWDNWDKIAPDQVKSYKRHILRRPLGNARIVSCHGHPRPHKIRDSWRVNNWPDLIKESKVKEYA